MALWRKKLFGLILVALLIATIVFWGTIGGACCLIVLIQSIQIFLYNDYASSDLAKTFEEDGKNVEGWRG